MLRRFVIPELQQRGTLDTTTFRQDGTPLHNGTSITQLFKQHFMNERWGRNFPHFLVTPDTQSDFWPWGYLKNTVYGNNLKYFEELKDVMRRNVRNISPGMLTVTAENEVIRFRDGGCHIEHVSETIKRISNRCFHVLFRFTILTTAPFPLWRWSF